MPRVEDRNSNMRMLRIDSVDDLIVKSMNVLEPALSDAEGKLYEDGTFFFCVIIFAFVEKVKNN